MNIFEPGQQGHGVIAIALYIIVAGASLADILRVTHDPVRRRRAGLFICLFWAVVFYVDMVILPRQNALNGSVLFGLGIVAWLFTRWMLFRIEDK